MESIQKTHLCNLGLQLSERRYRLLRLNDCLLCTSTQNCKVVSKSSYEMHQDGSGE